MKELVGVLSMFGEWVHWTWVIMIQNLIVHKYILVIDDSSEIQQTVFLKKIAKEMKDSFEKILNSSKGKSKLFGADDEKESVYKAFIEFSELKKLKNSRHSSKRAILDFLHQLLTPLKNLYRKKRLIGSMKKIQLQLSKKMQKIPHLKWRKSKFLYGRMKNTFTTT